SPNISLSKANSFKRSSTSSLEDPAMTSTSVSIVLSPTLHAPPFPSSPAIDSQPGGNRVASFSLSHPLPQSHVPSQHLFSCLAVALSIARSIAPARRILSQ